MVKLSENCIFVYEKIDTSYEQNGKKIDRSDLYITIEHHSIKYLFEVTYSDIYLEKINKFINDARLGLTTALSGLNSHCIEIHDDYLTINILFGGTGFFTVKLKLD